MKPPTQKKNSREDQKRGVGNAVLGKFQDYDYRGGRKRGKTPRLIRIEAKDHLSVKENSCESRKESPPQ